MLRRSRRRSGFSLVEVLVAMFIVAAGLIALMSLFPVGAVQMGKALQADRSQNTCLQADARTREVWRTQVTEVLAAGGTPAEQYYTVLNQAAPSAHAAGYPVLFDPVGSVSYAASLKQFSVAGTGGGTFPRRTSTAPLLTFPDARRAAIRLCVMPDDVEFATADNVAGTPADGEGNAVSVTGNVLYRHGRYNWAAVLQRPDNAVAGVADLKVLVFDRRGVGRNPTGVDENEIVRTTATSDNSPVANQVLAGGTTLTFAESNDTLGLRVGTWIMDGTLNTTPGAGIRNAKFYKVTSYNDVPGGTVATLHVPLARPTGEHNPALPYPATLYVLRELLDVYDRPQLTPAGYSKQTP